ncbi:MAG: methyltransferase [Myxococcota bacterium]
MLSGVAILDRLASAGDFLADVRDIVEHRVEHPDEPAWAEARRIGVFLRGLSDEAVEAAESTGLHAAIGAQSTRPPSAIPGELRALLERADAVARLDLPAETPANSPLPGVSERKQVQVRALAELAKGVGLRTTVLDVGAGHGHLTRELARALGTTALGLDRDPDRIARALELSAELGSPARFVLRDAVRHSIEASAGELVVGLHACGALGDALVREAAATRCHLLYVACCPQKIPGAMREPLSRAGTEHGLRWPRHALGLANMLATPVGIEAPTRTNLRARQTRYALSLLFRQRDIPGTAADHGRGLNRRTMLKGLRAVAERAFALRSLAPPSSAELRDAEARGVRDYALIRRYALVRTALGRPLEVSLALDRAAALVEEGAHVKLLEAFPRSASPRNLAIVARHDS